MRYGCDHAGDRSGRGPTGTVRGIDVNAGLIARAKEDSAELLNARFEVADIREARWDAEFDIVTSARVLQWLADPARALDAMARAARPGGTVAVLDYDHTRAEWNPAMPPATKRFYQAFLGWRAEAGLDNAIASHLPSMFGQAGLADVKAVDQREVTMAGDPDYQRRIALWRDVIASRGHQVVADGWLTEADRVLAEKAIRRWIEESSPTQSLFLRSVTGIAGKERAGDRDAGRAAGGFRGKMTAPPPKRSSAATWWGMLPTTTLELAKALPKNAIVVSR